MVSVNEFNLTGKEFKVGQYVKYFFYNKGPSSSSTAYRIVNTGVDDYNVSYYDLDVSKDKNKLFILTNGYLRMYSNLHQDHECKRIERKFKLERILNV